MTEEKIVETTEEAPIMEGLNEAIEEHIEEKESNESPEPLPGETPEEVTEEPEVKEPEVEVKEAGEELPGHDEVLLERAVRAGLSLSDAKSMPDSTALSNVISRLEAPKETKVPVETKAPVDPLSELADLDPEEYPEEVVEYLKGIKGVVSEQQKTIQGLTQQQQQAKRSAKANQFVNWFDAQVEGLGGDYKDTFGEGRRENLNDSTQVKARDRIVYFMDVVHNDAKREGRQIPNDGEIFNLAVDMAFPDKANKIKGQKVAESSIKRSRQVLNRPRDTNGQFASESYNEDARTDDAIAAVAAMMQ